MPAPWRGNCFAESKDNRMPVVNGEEVGKQHPLADGDVIEVAGVEMKFSLL